MGTRPQEQQVNVYDKKLTIRFALNIYGIFVILGFILSIFTSPISLNEQLQFVYHTEHLLKEEKVIQLIIFLVMGAMIYFTAVNIFYHQLSKRVENSEIDSASA
ncbi:hypothetical protein LCM23_23200 [Cytobacillus kochii]|uniref:hypothetical protein n=1 Tax=Cytobacillus kochii TaxID=859143 RepID=UPI001CD3E6E0|nr:hypothetical protein [Cytobacillus kochii]MCA1028946.1 hypothetical protein [Cytobacillus kochii]